MKFLSKIFLSSLIALGTYAVVIPNATAKATIIDNSIHSSSIRVDTNRTLQCEVRTSGGPLNVRKGPGTEYPCIGRLAYLERVERIYLGEDWNLVRYVVDGTYDTYKVGWISNEYTSIVDARGNRV